MITLDEFCETRTFRGTKLFVLSFTNLFWINRSKKSTLFRDTRPNDRAKDRDKTVRRLINTMQICEKKTMQIKRRFFHFEFRDSSRYDNVIKRKGEEKLLQEAGLCREKLSFHFTSFLAFASLFSTLIEILRSNQAPVSYFCEYSF